MQDKTHKSYSDSDSDSDEPMSPRISDLEGSMSKYIPNTFVTNSSMATMNPPPPGHAYVETFTYYRYLVPVSAIPQESHRNPSTYAPQQKQKCRYGARCYRKNPQHLKTYQHPPMCKWGNKCYVNEHHHRNQYRHPN